MAVVQFTRFGAAVEHHGLLVAAWRTSVEACRTAHPALLEALLVQVDGGEWLDIAIWASPGALTADASPNARDEFFGAIEELMGEEMGVVMAGTPGPALHH
jgi:hypothetical protein